MMTVHRSKIAYFNSRLRKETNLKEIVDSGFSIISIHVSLRRRTGLLMD